MNSRMLKHPPLIEHIFEICWKHSDGQGALFDEYELALGQLYKQVGGKLNLPCRERMTGHLPREVYVTLPAGSRLVFDRFVSAPSLDDKLSYPLVQYGPGIASYNVDKDNYDWKAVRTGILELFQKLQDVHPELTSRTSKISLRAIDFFETDNPADCLRKKFKINFNTDLQGVDQDLNFLEGATEMPRLQNTWILENKQTKLRLAVTPGTFDGKNGLFLDIEAESSRDALQEKDIKELIDLQHKLTGELFFALLTEELLRELNS